MANEHNHQFQGTQGSLPNTQESQESVATLIDPHFIGSSAHPSPVTIYATSDAAHIIGRTDTISSQGSVIHPGINRVESMESQEVQPSQGQNQQNGNTLIRQNAIHPSRHQNPGRGAGRGRG